jgi:cell division septation protein DedD
MIAVETVIRKLIGEYEFVIIPGFGALLSHQVPASFDKSSGFFTPPVKKLAFNEFLKLDDGLLANYISREETWPHADAVEYVRSYTDKLRSGIAAEGAASIAGIGEFKKNVEGKLVFEPNTGKYFKDEWYGFSRVKVKEVTPEPALTTTNLSYVNEDDVEVIELEERAGSKRKWLGWAAAAVITGLLCGLSVLFMNTSESEIRSTLNPFTELFANKKEVSEVSVPEVVSDEIRQAEPVIEEKVLVADSLVSDSSTLTVPAQPTLETPAAIETAAAPAPAHEFKFYVIAGAFKGSAHANMLLEDLKAKGFKEAIIIPGNKYSTKVKVAINGYDNESDAYRASAKLKEVIGEPGWVFKQK